MAKEKKETVGVVVPQDVEDNTIRYSKEQILASDRFAKRRDILSVLLKDGKEYNAKEVTAIMDGWFKKGVQ